MKLLIVTQAVDIEDPVLGFFVRWLEEFAKHVERIEVICLKEGKHDLPTNVHVHSLGKENPPRYARRLVYAFRFKLLAWRLRHDYDTVFVHMNPEYVVIGGLLWRLLGKCTALWYTHKSVDLKLRIAERLVDSIFTASLEGFRLQTPKLQAIGHGIDTKIFHAPIRPLGAPVRLVSVGRITPIKNPGTLIETLVILKEKGITATVTFIGAPTNASDEAYLKSLQKLAEDTGVSDQVIFAGSVSHLQMPEQYRHFDISVNLTPTGGLDKAVLESMAAGLLVFSSNQGFAKLFGPHASNLLFPEKDAGVCAEKIMTLIQNPDEAMRIRTDLQKWVDTMGIEILIPRILSFYEAGR